MNARKRETSPSPSTDKKPDPIERARALVSGGDKPHAEPDRRALEAYAAWLFYERRLLCLQLWPQLGDRSDSFVLGGNAGFNWHFRGWTDPANAPRRDPASRAAAILEMAGVDWASHPPDKDPIEIPDTGERPPLPEGWPGADAELLALVKAFVEADTKYLRVLDEDEDDPRLSEIDERRNDLVEEVIRIPARTVQGLHAKCEVIARIVDLTRTASGSRRAPHLCTTSLGRSETMFSASLRSRGLHQGTCRSRLLRPPAPSSTNSRACGPGSPGSMAVSTKLTRSDQGSREHRRRNPGTVI
jgi:hypothetical protein